MYEVTHFRHQTIAHGYSPWKKGSIQGEHHSHLCSAGDTSPGKARGSGGAETVAILRGDGNTLEGMVAEAAARVLKEK